MKASQIPDPAAGLLESAESLAAGLRSAESLFQQMTNAVEVTIGRQLDELAQEPSWGLLHGMYERAVDHAAACILLVSHEYFAASEALCRTVIEASVNLYYCSVRNSLGEVLSYFKTYIATERKQNTLWNASLRDAQISQPDKEVHVKRIERKELALQIYERILREVFPQVGFSYEEAREDWPSIYDRFKAIHKEVDYRTIYAALCSQAHNDPEDLLNQFVHGVTQVPGAPEAQKLENAHFSVFMLLVSIALLIESAAMYLAKYSPDATETLMTLRKGARAAALEVMSAQVSR